MTVFDAASDQLYQFISFDSGPPPSVLCPSAKGAAGQGLPKDGRRRRDVGDDDGGLPRSKSSTSDLGALGTKCMVPEALAGMTSTITTALDRVDDLEGQLAVGAFGEYSSDDEPDDDEMMVPPPSAGRNEDSMKILGFWHFFVSRNPRNLRPEPSSLVSTSLTHSGDDEDSEDSGVISLSFFAGISGIFPQNPAPKRLRPALPPPLELSATDVAELLNAHAKLGPSASTKLIMKGIPLFLVLDAKSISTPPEISADECYRRAISM